MDVDGSQIASSTSEAEEHLLSSLPSPKQVNTSNYNIWFVLKVFILSDIEILALIMR